MKATRWLLPFTHRVDMSAIDYVVGLAKSRGATLIPVSLISSSPQGARLELIQQSKDFLEAVQYKAERLKVSVERYEIFTVDVQQSVKGLAHELHCDGIILVTRGDRTCLLQDEEVKHLLIEPPTALVLMRLSAPDGLSMLSQLGARFFSRLRRLWWQRKGDQVHDEAMPFVEESMGITTEQYH